MGVFDVIGRGFGGFLAGGPLGAATGILGIGGGGGGNQSIAQVCAAKGKVPSSRRPGKCARPEREAEFRRDMGLGAPVPGTGLVNVVQQALPGGATGFENAGFVAGRYGRAMIPFEELREVKSCLPGMVLGKDDLCYEKGKGGVSNSQRMWPKGRRPLGTPGEMAALGKAAAFGRRMETTVKSMQKIGVLKKPAKRPATRKSLPPIRGGSLTVIDTE